jgi:hypothetical protein
MTKKNQPRDPRVSDNGQMMEPVLYPKKTHTVITYDRKRHPRPTVASPDLVVTISGATGAGKTVLTRLIVGAIMHPTAGAHYKYTAPGINGQNFRAGTDIEAHGDFRTVLIVETEA